MRKIKFFFFLLLVSQAGTAQSGYSGRYLVDTLCSEYFYGRGYVNNGVNRAAYFISHQFDSMGLLPLGKKYFQEFPMSVNFFPRRMSFSINGNNLVPGVDFQILPESAGGKKRLPVVCVDTAGFGLPTASSGQFTLLPRKWLDKFKGHEQGSVIAQLAAQGPLLLEAGEKLTWSVGREQFKYPVFEVRSKYLTDAKNASYAVDAVFEDPFYCNNVCAYVPGTARPDSFLVFTAHYDHLGGMGEETFIQGANDNASGTAMLLMLASYYKNNPHRYSVAFIAFAGEEAGLVGSRYFVENAPVDLNRIRLLFNIDLMGTGAEGATVVNATVFPKDFDKLLKVNGEKKYLIKINPRGEAANSDHYWFTQKGIPSFFMYLLDSSYTAYHNTADQKKLLPLTMFDETCKLLIDFFNSY